MGSLPRASLIAASESFAAAVPVTPVRVSNDGQVCVATIAVSLERIGTDQVEAVIATDTSKGISI